MLVVAQAARADDIPDWSLCGDEELYLPAPDLGPLPFGIQDDSLPIQITADQANIDRDGISIFEGNVLGKQGNRFISTERLEYDNREEIVVAPNGMRFGRTDLVLDGENAELNLATDQFLFENVEYSIPRRHGRGSADRIETDGEDLTRIYDLRYTTCPPGETSWELVAKRLRLNHAKEVGYGTNVFVKFKGVPIFWTPYISFPLGNQRKTGFLVPEVSDSNRAGFTVSVPHYWNIAPNYDLLMTPRMMSTRGNMLINDFRYLTTGAEGNFYAETLPNDKVLDTGREFYTWNQTTLLTPNIRSTIAMSHVTDAEYFNDLGNSLRDTRVTFLPRRADVEYQDSKLKVLARTQTYQVIDRTIRQGRRPYSKLPELRVEYAEPLGPSGLTYGGISSMTRFRKRNAREGDRLFVKPRLSWRNNDPGWFVEPAVGFQAMSYEIEEVDGARRNESVFAPIFSFDSGLIFERDLETRNKYQTLEPRIFMLYVPNEDHAGIPDFDTNLKDTNFSSLFSDNRFIGGDRIGDAKQVSLALTTTMIDGASGTALFSASIGQIYHFRDRQVTLLNGAQPDTADRSPVIGEIRLNPADWWSSSATAEWDSEVNQLQKYGIQFQFKPATDTILNLSYRFRRNTRTTGNSNGIEQTDLSFVTPVTQRWKMVGRWQYSLEDRRTLESFAGIEYESCCFAIRVVNRRFTINNAGETDRQLYLQLELKGMTSVGRKVDDFLEKGIFGYEQ